MGKRIGLEVSLSAAEAVKMANVDCIAAYPITPQTHIVEHLSELVNSQGLSLMNEIVHIVASMRLPIVMILANRSMSLLIMVRRFLITSFLLTGWRKAKRLCSHL